MKERFEASPYTPVDRGGEYLELPLSGKGMDRASPAGVPSVFLSTKIAGTMSYEPETGNPRRDAWISRRGFDPEEVLALRLVHSRTVVRASNPDELCGLGADGIVTANADCCAVITVADCMPIFLFDPDSGAFGVLHSGWKGTGILAHAIDAMRREWGAKPSNLYITFGPHIGTCCYPVDEERARVFSSEFGKPSVRRVGGKPSLDLLAANLSIAERCGAEKVSYTKACTSCDERLGSFRREGASSFTRMAACIGFPRQAARS